MGSLLGIGMTHAPMFQFPDSEMANIFGRRLRDPDLPDRLRDPAGWPDAAREEWGNDHGLEAAARHRAGVVPALRRVRAELDAFRPDFVLVFGDDQYENFKEDVVPTFCPYIFSEMTIKPFLSSSVIGARENVWGEPQTATIDVTGHLEAGLFLTSELIAGGFDLAWSMRPHHHPTLGHAFLRTLLYLDYDRKGFPWRYMPFHVNSYGSDISRDIERETGTILGAAPPAPSPARCFALGVALGRILRSSPYRVAIVGSSSWSHAFLTKKNHLLFPDIASDELRAAELEESRHGEWANLTLEEIRSAGQHELLNWICMAGAMGAAEAEVLAFAPTYIFNSTKVVALFRDRETIPV